MQREPCDRQGAFCEKASEKSCEKRAERCVEYAILLVN